VVDRVEAGVSAVDGMKERQHVNAAERPGERALQQSLHVTKRTSREAIGVGDQLRLILHPQLGMRRLSWAAAFVRMILAAASPLAQILVEPTVAGCASAFLRRIIAA
jgi:hypothetical protein